MPKVRNLTSPAPEIKQDAGEMFRWKQVSPTTVELYSSTGIWLGVVHTELGHVSVVPLIGGRVASTVGATSIPHAKERLERFWADARETVKRAFPEGGAE